MNRREVARGTQTNNNKTKVLTARLQWRKEITTYVTEHFDGPAACRTQLHRHAQASASCTRDGTFTDDRSARSRLTVQLARWDATHVTSCTGKLLESWAIAQRSKLGCLHLHYSSDPLLGQGGDTLVNIAQTHLLPASSPVSLSPTIASTFQALRHPCASKILQQQTRLAASA